MESQRNLHASCARGAISIAVALLQSACAHDEPHPSEPPEARGAAVEAASEHDAIPAGGEDELEELGTLWRAAAADPAALDAGERVLLESLFFDLLPPSDGALAGSEWQVVDVLGSGVAELHADLVRAGEQLVSIDAQYRSDLGQAGATAYGDASFEGYPAAKRSRFLFVLAGRVELRAQGVAQDWRDADRIGELLKRFPLEQLARL